MERVVAACDYDLEARIDAALRERS
jgi:hypothetical protein